MFCADRRAKLLRGLIYLFAMIVGNSCWGAERSEAIEPLAPLAAADSMRVPQGFQVKLFAGEPTVRQPIGFCLDDRARLWVAEAYNYPHHGTEGNDRIVILEDTNGDGQFGNRTVFYDQLNYITGIEVGFGGVWVMSPPYFYFIPDRNADDKPDSQPKVLLDGFGNHANSHNLANGFAWGPDGWLYGTHGRTNWSTIGKPGATDAQRERFDGGVWRYHPIRNEWEPFADGTTNPWGIDWDDYGAAFVCNCVNPHLFQVIQGAHYEPWRGRKSSQHAYQRIDTIADHLHYLGQGDVRAGIGTSSELDLGGGHAHCGTMVYLGDNWPASYRNTVFMNNVHGRRINNDSLTRHRSGYRASHRADLMMAADPWYMGITLQYGPGGEVYVSDWSDTGECHSVRNTRKHTGRIYRITYGDLTVPTVDLKRSSNAELVAYQLHENDWYVRHARRILQERFARGDDMSKVHTELKQQLEQGEVTRKLRALWALHATDGLSDAHLTELLQHESEYVRGWAVQLLCEDQEPPQAAIDRFISLARSGDSPLVRLYLAAALQRLAPPQRWPLAEALASRADDIDDQNIPYMLWYGVEPLVDHDRRRLVALAGNTQIPLLRRNIARRVASVTQEHTEAVQDLVNELGKEHSHEVRLQLLEGLLSGLEGRRLSVPATWPQVYTTLQASGPQPQAQQVAAKAMQLALLLGDRNAQQSMLDQAADSEASVATRQIAIAALADARVDALAPVLLDLLEDPAVQVAALRALAQYRDPAAGTVILNAYAKLNPVAKQAALQALAARPTWASDLLDALEAGTIKRTEIDAYTARQIQSLGDSKLSARLQKAWGEVRSTSKERTAQIASQRAALTPVALSKADLSAGRALFVKNCGKCHRLFGEGGQIGPDITGAQRHNLEYLLENVIDPSAAVSRDFLTEIIQTEDGRVLTGLLVSESEQAVTLQMIESRVVIPQSEVAARRKSNVSMMPESLLRPLSSEQVRDLFGYLQSRVQVPLP